MGEKRKGRTTNNERTSKKEKKSRNSVVTSPSNDDVEEQSSMHSNSSQSDNTSQQPSVTQENNNLEEIEESQTITPIDVENLTNDDNLPIESTPITDDNNNTKLPNESPKKSWWSSFVRLFHFGNNTIENKTETVTSNDEESSSYTNGSYLSNIKSRRPLHGESLVG